MGSPIKTSRAAGAASLTAPRSRQHQTVAWRDANGCAVADGALDHGDLSALCVRRERKRLPARGSDPQLGDALTAIPLSSAFIIRSSARGTAGGRGERSPTAPQIPL